MLVQEREGKDVAKGDYNRLVGAAGNPLRAHTMPGRLLRGPC